ncbi:type I glyceraldehyde-3-phosphate dehydrogenase [Geotalea sp. SG265]|uniref:type I glyceraldehyde-3-phosphate dehydrogenase n=1 Tax=Geotalea sp. SG265 TaxID=2922867 RepID=UPI001FAF02B2|nr:type I glyceraldehyde-3-phosphate dehydrogenase [Geotalea sp. SG265]
MDSKNANRRPVRVAINGFGRIGRTAFRQALAQPHIQVVAINDLADSTTVIHQFKYDSTHGVYPGTVTLRGDVMVLDGHRIRLLHHASPADLPWFEEKVDVVIEATGRFTTRAAAALHLSAGAGRVIISAPSADADLMLVMGVNDHLFDPDRHLIISNASCTTNCLAPLLKVLHEAFGIEKALMTTVHPYTNNQPLHDSPHGDLRRSRGGAQSIIPTTTTAIQAVVRVMPELAGRIDGMAVRVPTAAVANIDLVAELGRAVDAAAVNAAFAAAAEGPLQGVLGISEEPLVSTDFQGCRYSTILDAPFTSVVGDNLVKILAWYDNESGYSNRLLDLITLVGAS